MYKIPIEIKSEKELIQIAKNASECKVLRVGDIVKIKIRGPKYLYTFKTDPNSSDSLLKKIPCKVMEL